MIELYLYSGLYHINDLPGCSPDVGMFSGDTFAYLTIASESDAMTLQNELNVLSE